MIDIKNNNGELIFSTPVNEGCTRRFTLMKEDYVLLRFSVEEPVYFKPGDGMDNEIGIFELVDIYSPTYNESTGGYDYELRLDAYYWKWKNKKFKYLPEGHGQESAWNMTADLLTHAGVLLRNLKALGYKYRDTGFEVVIDDTVEKSAKLISYNNTSLIDALNLMAEAWGCEWWITDNIIHFGRCEYETDIKLEIGVEVASMPRDNNRSTFATRVYVFGSERNIPANYRPVDETVVVNGVVQRRLMLPADTPYLDAYRYKDGKRVYPGEEGYDDGEEMPVEEAIEDIVVFDDVYPRRTGTMENITTKEYTDKVENEDGSTTTEKWNAYRFKDSGITFSKDYIIPGQELRIIFQSGKLNGLEFGVIFNPDNQPEKKGDEWNPAAQLWEIVRNEDYGRPLPDDTIRPENGDKYILSGFDTKLVSDTMIPEAEEELKAKGLKYLAKTMIDPSTYNCTLFPNYVHEDELKRTYEVGDKVELINKAYFETSRQSRIIGYERKLDIPWDNPVYFVGEVAAITRIGEIEDKVDELTYKGQTYIGNGSGVYVIGLNDNTNPTNRNVYSALRILREFVKFDGWVDQPVRTGDGVTFRSVVAEVLRSMKFVDGFNGEGWQVWVDEDGVSRLTIDRLTVRQIMTVFEMVVERIRAVGGHLIVSAADGKIKTVEDLGEEYKITFEGMNYFQAHDLIRCHVYTGTTARGYWVEVTRSTRDGVVVKKSEFEDWGTSPRVGDECVLMGNTVDRNRQNFISISATEDGQPRIDVMSGVNRKSLAGCLRARLGNLDGISDSWFPADNQPHGDGLYSDNAYLRGSFLLVTGEDVKTKFEIVEGKLSSAISGLRDEGVESGYLSNPNFTSGLLNWDTESDTVFFLSGGKWILANGSVLASKGDGVSVVLDSWRTALRIRNRYILQKNGNMKSLPEIPEKEDGSKKAVPVYFSFYYRCVREGILTVEFVGLDKTGFEDFEELHIEETIVPTSDYVQFVCQGFWNGTGDFKLSFSGDMYISVLVLSTDKADALAYRYETLFEQSDKLVRISAKNFDKDGNVIESSQIVTKADMNLVASGLFNEDGSLAEGAGLVTRKDVSALFAIGKDGTLKSFIGASTEGIKLKAASISLEGLVTANGGFSILKDGSIVAVSGKIGNLILEGGSLKSDNMLLSNEVLRFNNEHGDIYLNGHPDTVTGGETKLGTFIVKGGSYGGLKSTNKVALICSAPTTREYDFDFYNSYAIWACGTSVFGGVSLRDRQGVRSGEVTITPDDSVLLIDGDVTLNADEVLAKSGIVHTLLIVNIGEGEPTLHGTEGRDRVIRFRNKCCKVVAYANGRWYPHSDYKD